MESNLFLKRSSSDSCEVALNKRRETLSQERTFFKQNSHLPLSTIRLSPCLSSAHHIFCSGLPSLSSAHHIFCSGKRTHHSSRFNVEIRMSSHSVSSSSKSLEGVHGVHVVPHAPFACEEFSQHGEFHHTSSGSSLIGENRRLMLRRVWQERPACLRPLKCCIHVDEHITETVANVLTSLPFIALGLQAPRKSLNMKIYANSLIGVGVASSLYHASKGRLRKYLRWADYTMIATATVCMSRVIRNENPKYLMAASAFFLPIQPLMVSAVHAGMMEVAFAKRAVKDPNLRMAHNVHKLSSLLGCALFIADDLFPETPFLHAGWHLAAAICVSTCNKLLE